MNQQNSQSTSNSSDLRSSYDRDGFVIVRQFLTKDELAQLQSELDRYIRDIVPSLPDAEAFYHDKSRPETLKQMQRLQRDSFFEKYTNHPKWKNLAERLVGEEAICQGPEWFNKPPGVEHPTPPHQDNYYFNLKPPHVLTLWLALDDVDEENGCLRYVAGSHLDGRRPHGRTSVLGFSQGITDYGPQDERREVKVLLAPGDLAVHHGWTIHRANANLSADRQRRSFAMVFRGVSCRLDEAAYQRYMENVAQQHSSLGLQT